MYKTTRLLQTIWNWIIMHVRHYDVWDLCLRKFSPIGPFWILFEYPSSKVWEFLVVLCKLCKSEMAYRSNTTAMYGQVEEGRERTRQGERDRRRRSRREGPPSLLLRRRRREEFGGGGGGGEKSSEEEERRVGGGGGVVYVCLFLRDKFFLLKKFSVASVQSFSVSQIAQIEH